MATRKEDSDGLQTSSTGAAPGSPSKRSLGNEAATTAAAAAAATPAATTASSSYTTTAGDDEHRQKRAKTAADDVAAELLGDVPAPAKRDRIPGMAMIKEEYLIRDVDARGQKGEDDVDDDVAEGREGGGGGGGHGGRKGRKKGGQNKDRDFGRSRDAVKLCASVAHSPELSPKTCRYGDSCRSLHDLRKYLEEGRRGDLTTFDGKCPVFAVYGRCPSGWKCRFVSSHMKEVEHEDGRKELVLVEEARNGNSNGDTAAPADGADGANNNGAYVEEDDARPGVVNIVSAVEKQNLTRKRFNLERSEQYIRWLDSELSIVKKIYNNKKKEEADKDKEAGEGEPEAEPYASAEDYRAQFVDPPFLPSEKRKIYFGPETPTLAPLTTQGNLPFRRLCVELGCEVTYSEMALAVDMVTGKQPEWALMKAHESETRPPRFAPDLSRPGLQHALRGYDNGRDLKFGAQIAANQPWMAVKATEAMARLLPHLRLIDMNCGCPIDLVYKTGGGSGLLEAQNKLERMIRGMNAVSGAVPITAKLRIGVRDSSPTAPKVIERLAFGGLETRERLGAPGCAAITLHGRTRNQRYKKPADWGFIAECAALVREYNTQRDALTDTAREPDARTQANVSSASGQPYMFFLGNGDCYSHEQYHAQIEQSGVDAVMIGRGAIIKPWLFEEIRAGQYLDKTATERLAYVEQFARYGMEAWGTDEYGLGTTRRFLLEYLSFATRYVPVGLLEYLPPSLNDRPQAFRGRNELETLLSSRNYKDWIKIRFVPKHKSNAYETEAQG